MKRSVQILLVVLTALLLAPTIAQAQKVVNLEPTKYGVTLNAFGEVSIERIQRAGMKTIEVFTLATHSDIPNREALAVEVETKSGIVQIGELRMLLTMGTMEKWSSVEPSPVFPIDQIFSVTVRYGKEAVLVGYFF
ncbi:MAG TPA: hypothetical protein VN851_02470 [Thermoanaerobaculia bacterium]|nr:hypothetical protein [Thermoanaerobaculia bacterium]